MNELYVMVLWPEIQDYMDHPRWNEVYNAFSVESENNNIEGYMVPEDLYNEVEYKKSFPRIFPNTSIGPVTCMENYAIVKDTEEYFWYDLKDIKKGDKVLVWIKETEDFTITTVTACSFNMPILMEDKSLFDGLNCEIVGFHGKESI